MQEFKEIFELFCIPLPGAGFGGSLAHCTSEKRPDVLGVCQLPARFPFGIVGRIPTLYP